VTSETGGIAVRAVEVRKAYGKRQILSGVSFEVRRGELFALLGPNGAGKTSTVEIIEGYRTADAGTVSVLGLDPAREGARLRPRMGLMLQEGGIDPRTTPREAIRLYARFYQNPEDPERLLAYVDLEQAANTRFRRLSGGERQRVAIARALVHEPRLLLADEPTAALDDATSERVLEILEEARRERGMTMLAVTYDPAMISHTQRMLRLHEGTIDELPAAAVTPAGGRR